VIDRTAQDMLVAYYGENLSIELEKVNEYRNEREGQKRDQNRLEKLD